MEVEVEVEVEVVDFFSLPVTSICLMQSEKERNSRWILMEALLTSETPLLSL